MHGVMHNYLDRNVDWIIEPSSSARVGTMSSLVEH